MPQSSRKLKVQEETNIKKSKPSNSSSWINQDWEEINDGNEMGMAEKDGDEKSIRNEQLKTPEASSKLRLPFDALIELGQTKSRILKVLNLFSKAYGPDWEQMIILQMTGSSGSNHQKILENSQPLQSTATKIKDEEERIEELIKDKNNTLLNKNNQEKLTQQLNQIQLLVQGMEKRLIFQESELIDLNQRAMSGHQSLKEKIEHISKQCCPIPCPAVSLLLITASFNQ
ncbi:hypothetical protein BY996DRAFT_6531954 [Phakopsora pachyrhizi]|nr:hypothetical protein BY996DRAFT_6531954 [Phakopsora pachyrhizi]